MTKRKTPKAQKPGPAPRRKVKGVFGKGSYEVHDHECKYCGSKCECHVDKCKKAYISDCKYWWPTIQCATKRNILGRKDEEK